jgi:hypothetical protein
MREGYLNMGRAAGISGIRDASSCESCNGSVTIMSGIQNLCARLPWTRNIPRLRLPLLLLKGDSELYSNHGPRLNSNYGSLVVPSPCPSPRVVSILPGG